MRKIVLSILLLSTPFHLIVFAQEQPDAKQTESLPAILTAKGQKLTLEQAIQLALERNHDLLSTRLEAAMSDSAYRTYDAKYDITLNASAGIQYQKTPPKLYETTNYKDQTTYMASGSVMKTFSTGTTFSAGVTETNSKTNVVAANDKGEFVNVGNQSVYVPVLFATIQQELLKNSFGFSDRAQLRILENTTKAQRNGQIQAISGLITGTLIDVWNVSLKKSARDIADQSVRETKRVRDVVAGNARLGISETYDLNLYNAMLAGSEASFVYADQAYRDAVRKLFRTFNYEVSGDLPELSDLTVLSDVYSEVNIDTAIKTALAKRVDYINAQIALESAKESVSLSTNGSLPSLVVSGTVSSTAAEDSAAKANGKASVLDTPTYQVKVAASYPLENTAQGTALRDSRYKVRQAELNFEKIRLAVKDDVVSNAEQIKVGYTAYQKAKTARQESERYYQSIQANLRMGKISIAVVKNALDSLNSSRQNELNALVQYNIILLQFDLATNELLEKYKVDVDKYIAAAN
ncbi:MAG TPA: TolC family protein [Spirochaetota bacterium]